MRKLILLIALLLILPSCLHAQTVQGTIINNGDIVQTTINQQINVIRFSARGTWTGTVAIEFSADNGATWSAYPVMNLVSLTSINSFTANGDWGGANINFSNVRFRATAAMTGTLNVTIIATNNQSLVGITFGGGGATIGTVNQGTANDASNNWKVNCVVGCAAATSSVDNGSVATGQTNTNANSLGMVYDGVSWKRTTIGTAGSPSAQVVTVQGTASGTNIPVNCAVGCTGGTQDVDDGTIASGQTTGLTLPLTQVFDGTNWKRFTVGTAGVASTQVLSVQGIASGTNLNVNCVAGCTGGTQDIDDGSIAINQTTGLQLPLNMAFDGSVWRRVTFGTAGSASAQVTTVQGIASMTPFITVGNITPANGFANPTTANTTWSLMGCWNGATWDRCPLSTGGAGVVDANTTRTVEATDSQLSAAVGAIGDAAATVGSTGSLTAKERLMTTQLDAIQTNTTNIAADQTGATPHFLAALATTNATSVKASAGRLLNVTLTNTTATIAYLRLYNLNAAPTCSSATGFVRSYMIPANTAGAGIVIPLGPTGTAFSTGIAYCATGGAASTDNTATVVGVLINLDYK